MVRRFRREEYYNDNVKDLIEVGSGSGACARHCSGAKTKKINCGPEMKASLIIPPEMAYFSFPLYRKILVYFINNFGYLMLKRQITFYYYNLEYKRPIIRFKT